MGRGCGVLGDAKVFVVSAGIVTGDVFAAGDGSPGGAEVEGAVVVPGLVDDKELLGAGARVSPYCADQHAVWVARGADDRAGGGAGESVQSASRDGSDVEGGAGENGDRLCEPRGAF